jgi:hypothetical protein
MELNGVMGRFLSMENEESDDQKRDGNTKKPEESVFH